MLKIEIIGNIGGDAVVKSENGRSYVQFSVADTRRYTKEDGTEVEKTNWVSCFMRNVESAVIPYLKKGTRVFVRGNGETRLFSSEKDRMMKAGLSINVQEIELVGGSSADAVPRELALPTGELVPVEKYYWIDMTMMTDRPNVVYDRHGVQYLVDANGFVSPTNVQQQPAEQQPAEQQPAEQQPAEQADAQQADARQKPKGNSI